MRKLALSLLAVVLMLPAAMRGESRWGATAGVLVTNLHFKQDLIEVNKVPGFSAGVLGEFMFPGVGFGVDLGLQYEMRGAKVHLGEKLMWSSQGYGDSRFYMHTLSIPVNLRFKYTRLNGFEDILAPLVYVGPEFGFTFAHSKCKAFSFPTGEVGLNFGLGAEICKRWQLTAQYTLGMTYCTRANILTDFSARNREWKVAVTYFW